MNNLKSLDELGVSATPWHIFHDEMRLNSCCDGYDGGHIYIKSKRKTIAEVGDSVEYTRNLETMKANARLFVLAPALYEVVAELCAVQELVMANDLVGYRFKDAMEKGKALVDMIQGVKKDE